MKKHSGPPLTRLVCEASSPCLASLKLRESEEGGDCLPTRPPGRIDDAFGAALNVGQWAGSPLSCRRGAGGEVIEGCRPARLPGSFELAFGFTPNLSAGMFCGVVSRAGQRAGTRLSCRREPVPRIGRPGVRSYQSGGTSPLGDRGVALGTNQSGGTSPPGDRGVALGSYQSGGTSPSGDRGVAMADRGRNKDF